MVCRGHYLIPCLSNQGDNGVPGANLQQRRKRGVWRVPRPRQDFRLDAAGNLGGMLKPRVQIPTLSTAQPCSKGTKGLLWEVQRGKRLDARTNCHEIDITKGVKRQQHPVHLIKMRCCLARYVHVPNNHRLMAEGLASKPRHNTYHT